MGLLVAQRLADGSLKLAEGDVVGVGLRIRDGDATLDWEGCADLSLKWDPVCLDYVVVCEPVGRDPYVVARHPRADAELIRKVAAADQRHRDPLVEVRESRARFDREQDAAFDDWLDNHIIPKSRWALRKDDGWDTRGQHVGYRKGSPRG